ncbi:MAG: CAP domain-containing protein [Vicinamibacterales bacterium]
MALTITTQPQSQSIASGDHATLSVAATGTGTLHYQWFVGAAGTTSAPVADASSASFTTPALTATTSYWVRVSDASTSADSATATITVTAAPSGPAPPPAPTPTPTPAPSPALAVAPAITTQPASQTQESGHTAQVSVQASGTAPLTYQWYVGASGSTSSPAPGATSATYQTPVLTSTTSYWVRVANTAGSVDSATATITITAPAPPPPPAGVAPAITLQPQSQSVSSGQSATLSVAASGTAPLSYQWYMGPSGSTSSPIGGATLTSMTTPALTTTTSYWVRVSNGFGSADSVTATVTVTVDTSTAFEDQVLVLVNQQRALGATCGGTAYPAAGALYMNANLRIAARLHSVDMATNNYFSHTSLDGRTFDQRIFNAGYTGSYPLGENIAAGQPTPASVVAAWMASPGHCTNIMTAGFHAIGIGYAFSASSTYGHYWTMDLGGS